MALHLARLRPTTPKLDFAFSKISEGGWGTDISYFEHQGVYFRLTEVAPYPVSTEQIAEEDYVITFEYQSVPFRF